MKMLAVFIGGGLGSLLRYQLGVLIANKLHLSSFLSTFSVNLIGSFLLGGLTAYFAKQQDVNSLIALMVTVGFCGGFTTFSTFSLDAVSMLKSGLTVQFLAYVLGSLVASFLLFFVGWKLVE